MLQRTQRDPTSSIRACLCTSDNCNILNSERLLLNNSTATKVVGKKCSQEFFASYDYLSSIKAQLFSAYHHLTPFDEDTSFHWDTRTIMKMIDFIFYWLSAILTHILMEFQQLCILTLTMQWCCLIFYFGQKGT